MSRNSARTITTPAGDKVRTASPQRFILISVWTNGEIRKARVAKRTEALHYRAS
jgi:hypothetical protein